MSFVSSFVFHFLLPPFKAAFSKYLFPCIKMSLVDLGKRLLEAARKGEDDEVRTLMANGAPFTTDWVCWRDTDVGFLCEMRCASALWC